MKNDIFPQIKLTKIKNNGNICYCPEFKKNETLLYCL